MAFGCLALTAGTSAGLAWQSLQSRVTPYVVEVDRLGEARAVQPADVTYRPTDPQVAWHLSRFITNVRSVSLDPVLMRRDWLSAYDFATKRGAQFLGEYARSAAPFANVGERTVSVQVTSVVRASYKSFQVKWTETAFERGSQAGVQRWTAILTTVTKPPTSADVLRKNPLGIYVDAIDWSRELDSDSTSKPVSPALPAGTSSIVAGSIPRGSPLDPVSEIPVANTQETQP